MAFGHLEKDTKFRFCGIPFTKKSSDSAMSQNGKLIPFVKTVQVDV